MSDAGTRCFECHHSYANHEWKEGRCRNENCDCPEYERGPAPVVTVENDTIGMRAERVTPAPVADEGTSDPRLCDFNVCRRGHPHPEPWPCVCKCHAPAAEEWCAFHHQHHGLCGVPAKPVADGWEIRCANCGTAPHGVHYDSDCIAALRAEIAERVEVTQFYSDQCDARQDTIDTLRAEVERLKQIEACDQKSLQNEYRKNAELRAALGTATRALREAKRHHLIVEDCWYSCPKATYEDGSSACCNSKVKDRGECNCGADAFNAGLDAALAQIEGKGEK